MKNSSISNSKIEIIYEDCKFSKSNYADHSTKNTIKELISLISKNADELISVIRKNSLKFIRELKELSGSFNLIFDDKIKIRLENQFIKKLGEDLNLVQLNNLCSTCERCRYTLNDKAKQITCLKGIIKKKNDDEDIIGSIFNCKKCNICKNCKNTKNLKGFC